VLVDFEKKQLDEFEAEERERRVKEEGRDYYSDEEQGEFYHPEIQREEQRRKWQRRAEEEAKQKEIDEAKDREKRMIIARLVDETQVGRERHKQLLLKRKHAQMTRLELLKQKAQARGGMAAAQEAPQNGDEDVEQSIPKRPKINDEDTPGRHQQ